MKVSASPTCKVKYYEYVEQWYHKSDVNELVKVEPINELFTLDF